MDRYPEVRCKLCGKNFETQIKIDPAIYRMVPNLHVGDNKFTCPHCNSSATYSERDFQCSPLQAIQLASFGKVVRAFVDHVRTSDAPLERALELFAELERARSKNDVSELRQAPKLSTLRKWLPNSPEKIAAYLAIAHVIVQLLTKEPNVRIEYKTVVNQINQIVVVGQTSNDPGTQLGQKVSKVGRNDPCTCQSGKKFKHCHGR